MRIAVLCPHFDPDLAPTGVVMSRIVHELAARGHQLHVVTSLPWYAEHRIDPAYRGRLIRREPTAWGSITRVHPFPTDKASIARRAAGFVGYSALAGLTGLIGRRCDVTLAMSPPLTLGLTGAAMSLTRGRPFVFNVQDVFPDVAIELNKLPRWAIGPSKSLERWSYRSANATTVLSRDLQANLQAKVPASQQERIRVIANFVDTEAIVPADRMTRYRDELGLGDRLVVMYAGNVGFSQSFELIEAAADHFADRRDVVFVVNGDGSAKLDMVARCAHRPNVVFAGYQPIERLSEVLATGDIHLVLLKQGLAASSVPSKSYSILAAGRPLLASIDRGTEIDHMVTEAAAGTVVGPGDPTAFCAALESMLESASHRMTMGCNGREWVMRWASPAAVAEQYEALFNELRRSRPR
jgi:colanic acid biosynthesis glycosyl transferase WcaI